MPASTTETLMPHLANLIASIWAETRSGNWLSVQTWLSGISAGIVNVTCMPVEQRDAIAEEMELLEMVCAGLNDTHQEEAA